MRLLCPQARPCVEEKRVIHPLDKPLPGDPAVERALLGAILLGGQSTFDQAAAIISEPDIHVEAHRMIWRRLVEMRQHEESLDRVTLAHTLVRHRELERVGGLTFLISLDEAIPTTVAVEDWARVILGLANRRRAISTAWNLLNGLQDPTSDVTELVRSTGEALQLIQSTPEDAGRTPEQIIEQFPGGLPAFLDPSLRVRGLPTGLDKLDEITDGLHPGELIIVGARPGVGKSALALNICQHLCLNPRQRRFGVLFSLEMNAASIMTRLMCGVARVDAQRFRLGYLNRDERQKLQVALDEIMNCRLKIFDKFGITIAEISRDTTRLVKDEGLQFMILDYIQLLAAAKKGENRNLEVSEFTRRLKVLAGDTNIPIIALSQLSRRGDQRGAGMQAPQLSDLRDSGSLEQDADSVWLLDREEMRRKDREDLKGLADIIVEKQRNGPRGVVKCRFLGQFMRFESMAEDIPA